MGNTSLIYTDKIRVFEYTDGLYHFKGQKVSDADDVFYAINNGVVEKDSAFLGTFSVRFEEGQARPSFNGIPLNELIYVVPIVEALIDELKQ